MQARRDSAASPSARPGHYIIKATIAAVGALIYISLPAICSVPSLGGRTLQLGASLRVCLSSLAKPRLEGLILKHENLPYSTEHLALCRSSGSFQAALDAIPASRLVAGHRARRRPPWIAQPAYCMCLHPPAPPHLKRPKGQAIIMMETRLF